MAEEPLFPYCEWFVNTLDCPYSSVHSGIRWGYLIGAALATVVLLTNFLLRFGKRRGSVGLYHVIFTSAIDTLSFFLGLGSLFEFIHSILVLYGGYTNYVERYIVHFLSFTTINLALVFSLYALMHSIPNAYMDRRGEIQHTIMPPRWSFLVFFYLQSGGMFVGMLVTAIVTGYTMDTAGIDAIQPPLSALLMLLGTLDVTLGFAYWFYCNKLIVVIRHNEETSSDARVQDDKSKAIMSKAVRRMQHLMMTIVPGLYFFGVTLIIFGALREQIQRDSVAASIFFDAVYMSVYIVIIIIGAPLLYWEVSGKLPSFLASSTNKSQVSSGHDDKHPAGLGSVTDSSTNISKHSVAPMAIIDLTPLDDK